MLDPNSRIQLLQQPISPDSIMIDIGQTEKENLPKVSPQDSRLKNTSIETLSQNQLTQPSSIESAEKNNTLYSLGAFIALGSLIYLGKLVLLLQTAGGTGAGFTRPPT